MSKFAVGEVCESLSMVGRYKGWREVTITEIYNPKRMSRHGNLCDYELDNEYIVQETYLRKKHPPEDKSEYSFDELIDHLNTAQFGKIPI